MKMVWIVRNCHASDGHEERVMPGFMIFLAFLILLSIEADIV